MIDLGNNSFHGEIPQELGKLFRLQYLLLLNNSFQGEFPTNLTHCSHLRIIRMHYNNLRGKIPTELGSLSNLSLLNLAVNRITGTIPLSIGNLSNLRVLCLSYNNLEGSIPTQLGQLSKLDALQLTSNNLSGVVPTSLYNFPSIYYSSILFNQLHGILPPDLGLTLPNLQVFFVAHNQFYGQIPSSIANATRLVQINLGTNTFTGSLPMNLGTLYALEYFVAYRSLGTNQGNELMSFLTSLSNCSNLQVLDLAMNHFKGFLPHSIGNLSTKITWFALEDNYIFGNIPLGIGNLVNLQCLFLDQNLLTGSIPNSIGKLSMLEKLFLPNNSISGEIPSSIRNLSRLGKLDLSTNMIEGSIPISLGNCTNLQRIYLDYNHLTGAISYQIFGLSCLIGLSLSQNYLTGLLPQEVGNLKNLGGLYVSKNKLFGEIPAALGNCEVLEFLYIDGNLFEGTIPTAFKQLKATNGFSPSNLIGEGGYGSVYKEILNSDEQIIAVKVLKLHERGANKSFVTECEALKNIRHRNLVKIITACSSIDFKGNDFKALVFEFMENGSLENWLHPSLLEQHEPKNLNFVQRLNIAIDVECALDYLHHHCEMAFIHCDLKPSNVLLDEYGMGEEVSTQGDMYSYGVLLLEMFTGKGPTSNMFTSNVNLHSYVKMCLPEQVMQIVDPQIILEMEEEPSHIPSPPPSEVRCPSRSRWKGHEGKGKKRIIVERKEEGRSMKIEGKKKKKLYFWPNFGALTACKKRFVSSIKRIWMEEDWRLIFNAQDVWRKKNLWNIFVFNALLPSTFGGFHGCVWILNLYKVYWFRNGLSGGFEMYHMSRL
ncbi:hypothetical protein ACSBR1_041214 [Camellia fascicularis]